MAPVFTDFSNGWITFGLRQKRFALAKQWVWTGFEPAMP
jgi:hypothetical protein